MKNYKQNHPKRQLSTIEKALKAEGYPNIEPILKRIMEAPLCLPFFYCDPLQGQAESINNIDNDFSDFENLDLVKYVLEPEKTEERAYVSSMSQKFTVHNRPFMEWQEHMQDDTDSINEYFNTIGTSIDSEKKDNLFSEHALQNKNTLEETLFEDFTYTSSLELPNEEQITGNVKEEGASEIINDTMHTSKPEIKKKIKEEINVPVTPSTSEEAYKPENQAINTKETRKNRKTKRGRTITKRNTVIKQQLQKNCVDVKTIPNKLSVLEANDPESLLEQFEAAAVSNSCDKSVEDSSMLCSKQTVRKRGRPRKQLQCQVTESKGSASQTSDLHEAIQDSWPKEDMIDRIKMKRRKTASVTKVVEQSRNDSNNTRVESSESTFAPNKTLKVENSEVTNAVQNTIEKYNSIHLDHDYYKIGPVTNSSDNNRKYYRDNPVLIKKIFQSSTIDQKVHQVIPTSKHISILKPIDRSLKTKKTEECSRNSILKKNISLLSSNVNDTSKMPAVPALSNNQRTVQSPCQTVNNSLLKNACQQISVLTKTSVLHNSSLTKNEPNKPVAQTPDKYPSKNMHSVLVAKILNARNKANSVEKDQKLISILKKQPIFEQSSSSISNSKESAPTITNNSSNEIADIPLPPAVNISSQKEEHKKVKKMTVEEYRRRREQNRQGGIRTDSSRTILIDIYHASTTTDSIGDNPMVTKEIVGVLKTQTEIEQQKKRPKPSTCDIETQTEITAFECSTNQLTLCKTNNVQDERYSSNSSIDSERSNSRDRSRNSNRKTYRRTYRSRSRNTNRRRRSRSIDKRKERSRSNSSDWCRDRRGRSRSSRRSDTRRRYSSTSSRSRSPVSNYKRNRRSSFKRTRSRSRSPRQRYSTSRSSSRSNYTRNGRSRRDSSDEEHYDRYKSRFYTDKPYYRKRSPSTYHRTYYSRLRENKQQMEVEERKIIYIGRIEKEATKSSLYKRFSIFGSIADIKLYFRDCGDNYGFVTYYNRKDAYEALEHGNDDPDLPTYHLCFGGRRAFCQSTYADLDGTASHSPERRVSPNEDSFDSLLEQAKRRHRSS